MAQLVKLQDYITRYEWDMYRYPSQYIRYKQTKWRKLYDMWEYPGYIIPNAETETEKETTEPSRLQKIKSIFKQTAKKEKETPSKTVTLPETEEDLKHYFLRKLLPFQLKWATSTVTNISALKESYQTDQRLQYFLQRFPDTYLLMYYPIFSLKKAPVDADIIIISPIGIDIIHMIEEEPNRTIIAGDERTWMIEEGDKQTKILSPYISLKRTEQIIKRIFYANDIQFPIQKVVLSRTNPILFHTSPYQQQIIGKHEHEEWFMKKRSISSPLKNRQLKATEVLLKNCQTTSVRRPEWEEDTRSSSIGDEME